MKQSVRRPKQEETREITRYFIYLRRFLHKNSREIVSVNRITDSTVATINRAR